MSAMVLIRTARQEDAARIAVLGAHVWVHTYAAAGVSEVIAQYVLGTFTTERIVTVVNDPGAVLLIAEADGNLAGYIVIRLGSHHADVPVEIETLYVQASFSGRGIGSSLLTHASGIAEAQTGNRSFWLSVNSQNEKAIAFYHSRGMVQEGIAYFELGGIRHENKIMVARG
ncbi:GCN5-related N-acetyltransferase [Burkholderia lata]|uniref:GNAT family N-acetyltransferase n=1 Tax=Burkholderia lata (strain ATCC 17760 / DSM 23089 / LMG 22485 / NCIMB 9086 / R18194 / 383) TaxID=482957 RepID=UPI001452AA6C|nr:N-acetyltransferase [Burkholderia lata]VWD42953.1 GCN5-related N-acetyltransferase [Burkholderia lata]